MKKILILNVLLFLLGSCSSNKVSYENIKTKIYSNNFNFLLTSQDGRKTFSTPAGTGRIMTSNMPVGAIETVGISVNKDKFSVNLPLNDKEYAGNKSSIEFVSYDFTVARKDLENGSILLNFFLNDQKDINLVKMEVSKDGRIDSSLEGPNQKPLLYLGSIDN
ncbi:hypothetical protein LUD75_16830 [Epilithonimonas sp. JDS]|uniref:hypothetical protein n=1 Tax=Epilithonimonas sp. JDS TaxID=2902797 RepID=UPI001E6170BF|nr:hypothetical protein [Epilithonimonas sp. JDS]MCD9856390.1 hypothetical protein [Epilithonimonas sp. JDS]